MKLVFVRIGWTIFNLILYFTSTTSNTFAPSTIKTTSIAAAVYNVTTGQPKTNSERLVDAYQKLRDTMSNKLSGSYPVPPKFYPTFGNIFAAFEPLQIITLDEVLQSISISSAITLAWRDPNVYWDPRLYEGIGWIKLPSSFFWLPNIIIPETAVEDGLLSIPEIVNVTYQGVVSVLIPTITTTLCNLDLTYFPFDEQNCTLAMIESEFYNMTTFVVSLGDMSKYFGTNAAWQLVKHECYPQISTDSNPPFSYVNCHVEISRRSAFYVINLIGPMAMTSLMTLLAFCVPAEGGEKVSFIVSMFMSTSVFYNYIINITPRSMENLPRINILLIAIAVQITFATAAIVFVLIRFSKSKKSITDGNNLQRHDNPKQHQRGMDNSKSNNARNISSSQTNNQNIIFGENCYEEKVKYRMDKPTTVMKDSQNEKKLPRKDTKKGGGRILSCDELDILFFCLMFVLTALLYFCAFFV